MIVSNSNKKPKVAPVVDSSSGMAKNKKIKKNELAKQLKALSIDSTKKSGIHRKLSDSSDSDNGGMEVDQIGSN